MKNRPPVSFRGRTETRFIGTRNDERLPAQLPPKGRSCAFPWHVVNTPDADGLRWRSQRFASRILEERQSDLAVERRRVQWSLCTGACRRSSFAPVGRCSAPRGRRTARRSTPKRRRLRSLRHRCCPASGSPMDSHGWLGLLQCYVRAQLFGRV